MKRIGRLLGALAMATVPRAGPLIGRGAQERPFARRCGPADAGESDLAPIPLPAGATIARDIAYGTDPAQRLDVYRPARACGAPVILFVHGGGWRRGDKAMRQMVKHKLAHWVGKGFVFVSTNYRMLPSADVIEQAEDVGRSLAFVQGRAGHWGGDPERVIVMGHSAGAHLVSMIAADAGVAGSHGARPWLATVALDSAALDMESIMTREHYRFYDPVFGTDPSFWRKASPMHRLSGKPVTPMLLVCSSERADSCASAREFAGKANGFGGRVTVLPVALTHRQINDQLGACNEYTEAVDAFLMSVGAS